MQTSDVLKEESSIPQPLIEFYVTLIAGFNGRRKKSVQTARIAISFSEDAIYNVTKGKI